MTAARATALARLGGRAVLALLSLGTCVLAPVIVPPQLRAICAIALGAIEERERRSSGHAAGWLVLAHAGATGLVAAMGAALGGRSQWMLAAPVLAIGGAIAVGAVWAPIALAPFARIDGEEGVVPAMVRSFELSARLGARRTIALGAEVGAIAGLAVPLTWATARFVHDAPALLVAPAWVALAGPWIALRLAAAYHGAKQLPAYDATRDPRVLSGLRGLLVVIAPALLALVVALGIAALRPLPMQPIAGPLELDPIPLEQGAAPGGQRAEIPGEHGLVIRLVEDAIWIETADGGGAGRVGVPVVHWTRSRGGLVVGRTSHRGAPAWVATVGSTHATYFDDQGVRLDDGLSDRLGARLARTPAAMLLLALVLGIALASLLSRSLRDARALDAPRWSPESPVARGTVARIEGVLRLGAGARIALARRRAIVDGDVHVQAGDVRIALPAEVAVLAMDDVPLNDGDVVTIVAATESLRALGPRQGAVPFPPGARFVPGDRDHAAERVLGRAARAASLVAIGIAAALGIASVALVLAP